MREVARLGWACRSSNSLILSPKRVIIPTATTTMSLAAEFRCRGLPSSLFVRNGRGLGARPIHDRDAADAVFWAALDDAVAVGHVYQHIALLIKEPDYL